MLSLSCDSLSTKQQYTSRAVVPAESWVGQTKLWVIQWTTRCVTSGDSRVSLKRRAPAGFRLPGLPCFKSNDPRHQQSRSADLSARVLLRRHESSVPKHGDRTQAGHLGSLRHGKKASAPNRELQHQRDQRPTG